jgi:hypothetical protein
LRFADRRDPPPARFSPGTAVTRRTSFIVRELAFATAMGTRTLLELLMNGYPQ